MFIYNNNIYLRALEFSDVDWLYTNENNMNLWAITNTYAPLSKYILEQYILNSHQDVYATKQIRLMIADKNNHENLGTIDLFEFDPQNARIGIGVWVHQQYQNNTIAQQAVQLTCTYVFNTLLLNQVFCHIMESNSKSIAVFEKCGFVKTGTKKMWVQPSQNTFEDVYFYQLLKK